MSTPYLIVGLGNPGPKYQATRHNIGFRCAEALAARHGLSFDKKQAKALVAKGFILAQQVILAKPQTYMNLSGDSVSGLLNFYKIPPEHLLVIFDDLDLPLGALRIRAGGGAGGQKGMKHIIQRIGTQDFNRIRFGIDRPPGRMDPADYVLLPFRAGDEQILAEETVQRAVTAIELWLTEGINTAMNEHNGSAEDVEQRKSASPQQHTPHDSAADPTADKPVSGLSDRTE